MKLFPWLLLIYHIVTENSRWILKTESCSAHLFLRSKHIHFPINMKPVTLSPTLISLFSFFIFFFWHLGICMINWSTQRPWYSLDEMSKVYFVQCWRQLSPPTWLLWLSYDSHLHFPTLAIFMCWGFHPRSSFRHPIIRLWNNPYWARKLPLLSVQAVPVLPHPPSHLHKADEMSSFI